MPTYTIRLTIVVPGLGTRDVDFPGLIAPTFEEAIAQAKAALIVKTIAGQQTAP